MSRAHLLSLKVLRTSPASLTTTTQSEPSNTLTLPNSFGTIYQGERFTGLISLRIDQQQHSQPVLNPKLLVEIQSPNLLPSHQKSLIASIHAPQLVPPSDIHQPDPSSQHQEALELVINHQIVDLGLHSLICTVTYQEPPSTHDGPDQEVQAQIRSFRKLYKFQVLNPLALKTKIYRYDEDGPMTKDQKKKLLECLKKAILETDDTMSKIESTRMEEELNSRIMLEDRDRDGCYYCEIQIQNQCSKALLDLTLKLSDPSRSSTQIEQIEDLTARADHGALKQIFPGDIHQYSFKVLEKIGGGEPSPVQDLKLELIWRSFMGEPGRIIRTISHAQQPSDSLKSESPKPSPSPISGMVTFETMSHSRYAAGETRATKDEVLFKFELVSVPASRRVAVGRPFQIEFRLSLCCAAAAAAGGGGGGGGEVEQEATSKMMIEERLRRVLHTGLATLRLHDLPPSLILLTPQPLQPSQNTDPTSRDFLLDFLLTHPPIINPFQPILHPGRLSTSLPHLDLLFGFADNPNPFGSLFVHYSSS